MFRINTVNIFASCDNLNRTAGRLSIMVSEFEDSVRAVSGMKGMEHVVGVLRDCQGDMENEETGIKNCTSALERIDETYQMSENRIIQNADGSLPKFRVYSAGAVNAPQMSSEAKSLLSSLII